MRDDARAGGGLGAETFGNSWTARRSRRYVDDGRLAQIGLEDVAFDELHAVGDALALGLDAREHHQVAIQLDADARAP